jgi:hypothetical protein
MSLEVKSYDLRKFSIKDYKDVVATLDVIEKFIPAMKIQIKKLVSENAAKTSVIRNLERSVDRASEALAPKPMTESELVQSLVPQEEQKPEFDKEKFIEIMRQSRDTVEQMKEEVVEPILEEKTPENDSTTVSEPAPDKKQVEYVRKITKKGKEMWFLGGRICKISDVPQSVKDAYKAKDEAKVQEEE